MDNEELRNKMLRDIKRSGFLSEMKTNSILLKCGWANTHNAKTFLDKDLNKSREIDITTYKVKFDKARRLRIGIHLIIEVKKSKKPWIIFCQNRKSEFYHGLGWSSLNFNDNITRHELSYEVINLKNRHAGSELYGTSYYEAFKETSETSQVYSALITSCKAAVYTRELNSWGVEKKEKFNPLKNLYVDFFLPIVVLDGLLFNSILDSKGKLDLVQTQYSPIRLNYSSNNYDETTFYPEITTLNGLEEHLNHIENWHQSMYDSVIKKLNMSALQQQMLRSL